MKNRTICRITLAAVLLLFLLYSFLGERVFPALRTSECEKRFEEGQQVAVSGRIYKKELLDQSEALYLERIGMGEERLLVRLTEDPESDPYDQKRLIPAIGQLVTVEGTAVFFQEAPNPGNFNQKSYYQKQNIPFMLRDARVKKADGKPSFVRESLWRLRLRAVRAIREYADEKQGGLLCSILFGETAFADAEEKELFQRTGIAHLLAQSGLHAAFVAMGLYRLLRKAGCPIRISASVGCVILCLYVIMTGESVSSVRACVMFGIRMGAAVTGREYDGPTALAAAALAVLLRSPLYLFDAGFLLSFGAMLGIYVLLPCLKSPGEERRKKTVRRKVAEKLLDSVRMSAAVQMAILPAQLYYYYEINFCSLLWNLIAIPLAGPLMGAGFAGTAVGCAGLAPAKWLLGIACEILKFYERGSELLLEIPGARLVTGQPAPAQILFYYLAVAVILLSKKKAGSFYRLAAAAVSAAVILIGAEGGGLEIVMLDVDQGDCFFLRGPDGAACLIDGGSSTVSQVGKYRIEPFLKSQGVGTLDYVWISHGDLDHLNGIMEMLQRQKVGVRIRHLVLPPEEYWEEKLRNLALTAEKQGVQVLTMEQGQSFEQGGMRIACLWPARGGETEGNESSMVLSLTYGAFDMLFTGDLEKRGEEKVTDLIREEQEEKLLPERYEVLKAAHHGSRNATGNGFLETVKPSCVFLSAGKRGRYGHPHAEVLERLANSGISLYNTKDGSAVKLCTDGEKYSILIP